MNKLRKEFNSDVSHLRSQINFSTNNLKKTNQCGLTLSTEIDELKNIWTRIDSNVGLSSFISFYDYQDLKFQKDQIIEDITLWLSKKHEEESIRVCFTTDVELRDNNDELGHPNKEDEHKEETECQVESLLNKPDILCHVEENHKDDEFPKASETSTSTENIDENKSPEVTIVDLIKNKERHQEEELLYLLGPLKSSTLEVNKASSSSNPNLNEIIENIAEVK